MKNYLNNILVLFLSFFLILTACKKETSQKSLSFNDKTTLLYNDLPVYSGAPLPCLSPNGQRFTVIETEIDPYADTERESFTMVVDGKKSPRYNKVRKECLFSPDSKRVAYVAKRDNKWFVVLDGKEQQGFESVDSLVFSPDSQRFAYRVREGLKSYFVVDGTPGKAYDQISDLIPGDLSDSLDKKPQFFSPNNQKFFYIARSGSKEFLVVNGVEGKAYDNILDGVIAPNTQTIAFRALLQGKLLVVTNEKESPSYDYVSALQASLSNQIIYVGEREGKSFLVTDDEKKEMPGLVQVYVSPSGKRLGLEFSTKEDKRYIVVDNQKGKEYSWIDPFFFSPDSKHFVYIAWIQEESFDYDFLYYLVFDGEVRFKTTPIDSPIANKKTRFSLAFSPDSRKFASLSFQREKHKYKKSVAVCAKGDECQYINVDLHDKLGPFVFSEDGRHLAFRVKKTSSPYQSFLTVDGKKQSPFVEVWDPIFSPDGKFVGSNTLERGLRDIDPGDKLWWTVEKSEK